MPRKPVTINAEKNELLIQNSNGDYAIIPTKLRGRVQSMIENGCDECIDDLVSTLPSMDFYTKANKAAKGAVVSGETGGVQPKSFRELSNEKTQANKQLSWVDRQLKPNPIGFKAVNAKGEVDNVSHRLAAEVDDDTGNWYVFPTVDYDKKTDTWIEFNNSREAMSYFKDKGELMDFGKDKDFAIKYSENGLIDHTSPQKRKVVVVSEYPLKSEYDLDKAVSESYKKRLPKDLQNIATKYDQSLTKYSEASTKRKQLINDVKNAYLATNPNKTDQTLTEADLSIIQDVYTKNIADLKLEDPEKAYKEVEANVAEFYKSDTNPKKRDETFPKEGHNIVDYFKKKDPNVEVVLKNAYKDDPNSIKDLKETLSSLNPQDDIVIQAHQGANKILGFSNSEFASMLGQSPAETIYAGVCNFGETCEPYKQLNKNLYYRPDTPWLGFDPTADTFLEGMYRRTYSDQGKTIVSPLIEGKSYISRPKQ